MKLFLISISLFGLGLAVGIFWPEKNEIEHHWEVVRAYREQIFDSASHRVDEETGFTVIDEPVDLVPSLETLVSSGEIEKATLVFPDIPYSAEATRRWLAFCNENMNEIIDGHANPSTVGLNPSGEQPFFCTVYYKPEAIDTIQQMIAVMEEDIQAELSTPLAPSSLTPR